MAARLARRDYQIVSGGTDNHLFLVSLIGRDDHRQGGRRRARESQHHGEQERRPERSASARDLQRPAPRHSGRDHTRLQGARGRAGGRSHRRCVGCGRRAAGGGAGARRRCSSSAGAFRCTARRDRGPRRAAARAGNSVYCPFCGHIETKVTDSRLAGEGRQIRRRRECLACGERFTTFETAELVMPMVVKGDRSARALRRRQAPLRHGEGAREASGAARTGG